MTPIYYVFFTTCVIIASAILFNEFAYLPIKDWVGLVCGFLIVLIAIFLLHLCKNFDFTLLNLAQQIDIVNDSVPNETPLQMTSARIYSLRETDLKDTISGFKSDEEDDIDVYKSVESSHSAKNSRSGSISLTPDVKLLSSTENGRRNRAGYMALYGTTDDIDSHHHH